jgi:hypothetical protein
MVDSPTRTLYAWMREETEGQSITRLPELTDRTVERLLANQDILRAYLTASVRELTYDFAQRFIGQTRGHVLFGDDLIARPDIPAIASTRRPRWQAWMEHIGDRHVRLFDMMKGELLSAASLREERGHTEYQYAALWRELAGKMTDVQSVKEVFTEKQVEEIAASLRVRVRVRRQEIARIEEAAD